MMTSSNGNIIRVIGALGGEIIGHSQKKVTRSFQFTHAYIDGLVHGCSNAIANAPGLL